MEKESQHDVCCCSGHSHETCYLSAFDVLQKPFEFVNLVVEVIQTFLHCWHCAENLHRFDHFVLVFVCNPFLHFFHDLLQFLDLRASAEWPMLDCVSARKDGINVVLQEFVSVYLKKIQQFVQLFARERCLLKTQLSCVSVLCVPWIDFECCRLIAVNK